MMKSYNSLPKGWKRLIGVIYILFALWAVNDDWRPDMPLETLFVFAVASLMFWIVVLLVLWVVDGFK